MKLFFMSLLLVLPVQTFAQCVDFTGKYKNQDQTDPIVMFEYSQQGCKSFSESTLDSNGYWMGPISATTDGVLRKICSTENAMYCSMLAYSFTSDGFKAYEVQMRDNAIFLFDDNTLVKLPNGNIQLTNHHVDYDRNEDYTKTIVGILQP